MVLGILFLLPIEEDCKLATQVYYLRDDYNENNNTFISFSLITKKHILSRLEYCVRSV